jgi:predicted nucleotidyltransferase
MKAKFQTELDTIVKAIAETGLASKIILFGSLARGEETDDSDIDLCVITPVTDRRGCDISNELRIKLVGKKKLPLDLLTFHEKRFEEEVNYFSSIAQTIQNEGRILYG